MALRREQAPTSIDLPKNNLDQDFPPISALFLIYFDIKAGYTIGWKRAVPGVELEGVVEYKSLPSGLHTVKEDLIYFVHDNNAGLSAFVNAPAAEESRNARMIAVGVMVPLSYGRLGRSWKHAENLKELASELIKDTAQTEVLEEYWEEHKTHGTTPLNNPESPLETPSTVRFKAMPTTPKDSHKHNRNRSASDGAALLPPGQHLAAYHPARSLPNLLEAFGPLIFPLHRAALLRKRILLTGHAPVQESCNFVYDISVLSNIPLAVSDLLASTAPPQRLRPLFSIGVHDIPLLEEDLRIAKAAATTPGSSVTEQRDEPGCGWIACTTDSILAMKSSLYDVLITMPPLHSENASQKVWPKIESPQGVEMRATQRDLRRYTALKWGLSRQNSPPTSPSTRRRTGLPEEPEIGRTSTSSTAISSHEPQLDIPDTDDIIEPQSWAALAYSGFMWWASAGEQRNHSEEESDSDAVLLSGLTFSPAPNPSPRPHSQSTVSLGGGKPNKEDTNAKQEMAIIAYFHRLTTQILTTVSDLVDATDSDDEREDESHPLRRTGDGGEEDNDDPVVYISSTDIERMGLDVWSSTDHIFIEEVAKEYFARRAHIEGRNVDICGVRIC